MKDRAFQTLAFALKVEIKELWSLGVGICPF
jgi:hypothetical protein